MFSRHRQDSRISPAPFLLLVLGVASYLSSAEARGAGGNITGGHAGGVRGGTVHARLGGGFRGSIGHQAHRGVVRPGHGVPHPFRSSFTGSHRFRQHSSVLFNFGGFAYPFYPYYPPYQYYPPYPAYPVPYDPGYSEGGYPYPYPDPAGVPFQTAPGNVQVYMAPPEPAPPSRPQPTRPIPESPPPVPLDDGSLHFEISPPEAKIFLDDRYVGEARELANLAEITAPAGRHLLEFRLGQERTFTDVLVIPHRITPVRWDLAPAAEPPGSRKAEAGRLRVQVAPQGAAVYLDGVFATAGEGGLPVSLRTSPGRHRIQMVMPGYKGYAADVTVPEGGEAVVAVQLARE